MLPSFIVEEALRRQDGTSSPLDISGEEGSTLLLTLGINRIIEQESLDVAVYGSKDGQEWDQKPLASFPQKFYCGTYAILVDLSDHPAVRFLRVQWKMSRWGRGDPEPLFSFYVFAEKIAVPAVTGASGS
jgi:hypothetical protein